MGSMTIKPVFDTRKLELTNKLKSVQTESYIDKIILSAETGNQFANYAISINFVDGSKNPIGIPYVFTSDYGGQTISDCFLPTGITENQSVYYQIIATKENSTNAAITDVWKSEIGHLYFKDVLSDGTGDISTDAMYSQWIDVITDALNLTDEMLTIKDGFAVYEEFNPATEYSLYERVYYNGSTYEYINAIASSGHYPLNYASNDWWQLQALGSYINNIATTTVLPNVNPSVSRGINQGLVDLNFSIPRAPTVGLNATSVITLNPAQSPTITNTGANGDNVYTFGIPRPVNFSIGNVVSTNAGTSASVTLDTNAAGDKSINFAIPRGSHVSVGTTSPTTYSTDNPAVSDSGTNGDVVLDFTLPRAPTISVGTTSNVDYGTPAEVVNSGTNGDVVLDFTLQSGPLAKVTELRWRTTLGGATGTVAINITDFNASFDLLHVYINSTYIAQGSDYTISGTNIVKFSGTWATGTIIDFVCFRSILIPAETLPEAIGDLPIPDPGNFYPIDTIDGALQSVGSQLAAIQNQLENNANVHYVVWDKVNAVCTRGGASASVTTTTTKFGHFGSVNSNYNNPFDQFYPWSGRKLCNVDIPTYQSVYAAGGNLLDCVVAWEGDVDFALDGSNGFVGVYTPEFWGLRKELDGGTEFLGVSPVEVTGWNHYEETIGGRWFGVADSTGITSKPGIPVINETMSAIHARATAYDMTLDDIYTWAADSLLLAVEYTTLNSQYAIGPGADSVYVQGIRPYIAETTVNRVVMTDNQSANFRAGVIIDIGTSDGGYQIARRIVTSVEDYTPDSAYAIVNFDGAAVNVDTAHYVSAHGTSNIEDSDILSTSGYIGTNGKCNAYYRGRIAHANLWRYVLGAYRQTGNGRIWIAKSRDEAAAYDALNTDVHTDTGFDLPTASNYIASLHFDNHLFPFAKTVGGGSDKPVGDCCYVPTLATVNTVLLAGGNSSDGALDGRFYGIWYYTASFSSWALSGLPFLKTP